MSTKDDGGAGASQALNNTITAIMKFLGDDGARPPPGKEVLRPFLDKKLAKFARYWLGRGFNRGHKVSRALFEENKKVPRVIRYEGYRVLFPGQKRKVKLKSKTRTR
jgi:hypothetical protein